MSEIAVSSQTDDGPQGGINQTDISKVVWAACDSVRGIVDPSIYKDYVLTMLVLKYISDVWQDHYERDQAEYGDETELEIRRLGLWAQIVIGVVQCVLIAGGLWIMRMAAITGDNRHEEANDRHTAALRPSAGHHSGRTTSGLLRNARYRTHDAKLHPLCPACC